MATADTSDIMTLKEVAVYLGLHAMTVYKLVRSNDIPRVKIGGQWRFRRTILDEWIANEMRNSIKG